jgi:hypothetical protein
MHGIQDFKGGGLIFSFLILSFSSSSFSFSSYFLHPWHGCIFQREFQRASVGCAGVGGSPAPPAPTLDPPLDADKSEATPAGKGNKSEAQDAAPEPTPSGKGRRRVARTRPKRSSSHCRSITEDDWTIMKAYVEFCERDGPHPSTMAILSAVENQLSKQPYWGPADIYLTVEKFRKKYETGSVPSEEDEFEMYKLSERVWGNTEKLAATATTSTANRNGDSQKGSKKAQSIQETSERDRKSRLSKEATTTGTPSKSKKQENQNEDLDKVAKSKMGKTDKGKMDIDRDSLMSKEAAGANQNGRTLATNKEGETHDDEIERDANVEVQRSFDELQGLYSNLSFFVEEIAAQIPCGETLKRVFDLISDEKKQSLESEARKLRVSEVKEEKIHRADLKKEVMNALLKLPD